MSNIKLFENKKVRSVWSDEKKRWYFVIADVIQVLTDSVNVTDYIKKLRIRDSELGKGWGQIVTPLVVPTEGGPLLSVAMQKELSDRLTALEIG